MDDSIKFIFKTLFKVPVIIFVSFFILNVFAFFFIYFKVLGLSYVVMQEVVENNYITQSQFNEINKYFKTINDIPMASNTSLIVGKDTTGKPLYINVNESTGKMTAWHGDYADGKTPASSIKLATSKCQYGQQRMIGVHCEYTIIWPLSYQAALGSADGTNKGRNVDGAKGNDKYKDVLSTTSTYNQADDTFSDQKDGTIDHRRSVVLPFDLYYTVPGLKYYADQNT